MAEVDSSGDDDILDDDILDDAGPDAEAAEVDDADEEEWNDEVVQRTGGKKKWILIGGGAFLFILFASGGAWIFLGGDDHAKPSAKAKPQASNIPVVSMALPVKKKLKSGDALNKAETSDAQPPAPTHTAKPSASGPSSKPIGQPGRSGLTPPPHGAQPEPQGASTATATDAHGGAKPAAGSGEQAPGAGFIMPSVTAASFRDIPLLPRGKTLATPDVGLMEESSGGQIPKVGQYGETAWQTYARPFTGDVSLPRIAITITGLGLSRTATVAAITQLPAEVTLSFNPYAKNVGEWLSLARAAGHEALLALPLETADYPKTDPGPMALFTDLETKQNIDRLNQVLALAPGYIGLIQMMGSEFARSEAAFKPVLVALQKRGLLFVDSGQVEGGKGAEIAASIGLPRARGNLTIDTDASKRAINAQLLKLEAIARREKRAVGLAAPLPISIAAIAGWAISLKSKKIALAPISAVVEISGDSAGQSANPQNGHK